MKQALDLGTPKGCNPPSPCAVSVFIDVIFSMERVNEQNWLNGYELYTIPVDNLTRT